MKKHILILVIIFLFISSTLPITFGSTNTSKERSTIEDYNRYLYPEYYHSYNVEEIPDFIERSNYDKSVNFESSESIVSISEEPIQQLDGPMGSPWPMYCHDVKHTGRSPYSTSNNLGIEKWQFDIDGWHGGSPIIDNDGIVYTGSGDLYAIYPNNGSLKWNCNTKKIVTSPAIDENGIIYVGSIWGHPNYFYAIYSNNGTIKWKYETGYIWASPTIGEDGTIYIPITDNWNIIALYPNGTQKWGFHTDDVVYSSPAIGLDGTIYCGSHDYYVYALYPNNGTLKWKFATNGWVHGSPTVTDDGIIYIGSDDGYIYSLYPNNGTMIWKCNVGGAVWGSPALDEDGNLYIGTWNGKFHAIYPNGTIKWSFNTEGHVWFTSAALSADGTLYFGNNIGDDESGEIIALDIDGTLKWRKTIATDWVSSAPAIDEDGIVYIVSANDLVHSPSEGYLHAFGELEPDAPSTPEINGPPSGRPKREYDYTFTSTSPLGNDVYYWVEWGDGAIKEWDGPHSSGEEVTLSHTWSSEGTYTIKARAKDTDNLWGPWSSFEVSMPRNRATSNVLFLRFLERFPLLEKIFSQIMDFN